MMQADTIAWRLCDTTGTNDSTQIYHFLRDIKLTKIIMTEILSHLREAGHAISEETLGVNPN